MKNKKQAVPSGPWQVLPGNSPSGPKFCFDSKTAPTNHPPTAQTQSKINDHHSKTLPSSSGNNKNTSQSKSHTNKKTIYASAPVLSERAQNVIKAFQTEIDRLSEKINHWFFKWFTWNKPLVQEKIEALTNIKKLISLEESKIYVVIEKIHETSTEEQNSLSPNSQKILADYYKLKQHRYGFIGNSTTQDNLINAFKKIPG